MQRRLLELKISTVSLRSPLTTWQFDQKSSQIFRKICNGDHRALISPSFRWSQRAARSWLSSPADHPESEQRNERLPPKAPASLCLESQSTAVQQKEPIFCFCFLTNPVEKQRLKTWAPRKPVVAQGGETPVSRTRSLTAEGTYREAVPRAGGSPLSLEQPGGAGAKHRRCS